MTRVENIGALDQRVVLETQYPAAYLDHGGRTDVPVTAIEVWASVAFAKASASDNDDRRSLQQPIDVTLRWRADITPDTDVLWRSKRYRVMTIEPLAIASDWLLLRCIHDA